MLQQEIEDWASAYIEIQRQPELAKEGHPHFWAVEKFIAVQAKDSEACWFGILEVLSRNPPQTVLGMLAAGPLEDLIHYHGQLFIERIEFEAKRNEAFKFLLGGVWESGEPEVWSRIQKVRGNAW